MLALIVWMMRCDDMCRYDQFREKLEREGDVCQYVEALVKMAGSEVKGLSNLRGVCDLCSKPQATWEDMDCCALLSRQQLNRLNRTKDATRIKLLEQHLRQVPEQITAATRTIGNTSMAGKVLAAARDNTASNLQNVAVVLESLATPWSSWFAGQEGPGQPHTGPSHEPTLPSSWFGQQQASTSQESTLSSSGSRQQQAGRSEESTSFEWFDQTLGMQGSKLLSYWLGGREGSRPQQTASGQESTPWSSWFGGHGGPGKQHRSESGIHFVEFMVWPATTWSHEGPGKQHSGQSQESTSSSSWFGQQPSGPSQESSPLTSWLGGHGGPGKQHSGQSQESASSRSWFGQQPTGNSPESSPLTSWLAGHEGPGKQHSGRSQEAASSSSSDPSQESSLLTSWLGGHEGPGKQHSGQSQESASSSSWGFGQQPTGPSQESSPLTSWLGGHDGSGKQHTGLNRIFSWQVVAGREVSGDQQLDDLEQSVLLGSWLSGHGGPRDQQKGHPQESLRSSSWSGEHEWPPRRTGHPRQNISSGDRATSSTKRGWFVTGNLVHASSGVVCRAVPGLPWLPPFVWQPLKTNHMYSRIEAPYSPPHLCISTSPYSGDFTCKTRNDQQIALYFEA